jgi:hypothetical protein
MNTKKLIRTSMIALLVVALSVSMAAANPAEIDISPDPMDLVPGSYVTTTGYLYEMYCDGTSRTLNVTYTGGNPNDLTFKITDPGEHGGVGGSAGPSVGSISYTYTPTNTAPALTEYNITVEILAAAGTEGTLYHIEYMDMQSGISDTATATVHTTAIPEFATIAIPRIALLGLVLYMRRKKD